MTLSDFLQLRDIKRISPGHSHSLTYRQRRADTCIWSVSLDSEWGLQSISLNQSAWSEGPSEFVRRNRTAHGAHLLSRAVKLERLSKMFLKSLLGFEGDRRVKAALAELE